MINEIFKSNRKLDTPVAYGIALLIIFVAYKLSFQQAISAVIVNRQLDAGQEGVSYSESALAQLNRKNEFYLNVLKEYQIKKEDKEGRLWSSVSGIALAEDVGINFSPSAVQELPDSTDMVAGRNYQEFMFKGNYANLVKLIDTLGKTKGIGKIAELSLSSKRGDAEAEDKRLTLRLGLVSVDR